MDLIPLEQARRQVSGRLSPRVLDYILRFKQMIELGKSKTVDVGDLAPIAELLDTARFERIGGPGDTMGWERYVKLLCGFANSSDWSGGFRRITEAPGRVYLELEERGSRKDGSEPFVVNSITLYEFDEADKLVRLWVYLQHPHEWS